MRGNIQRSKESHARTFYIAQYMACIMDQEVDVLGENCVEEELVSTSAEDEMQKVSDYSLVEEQARVDVCLEDLSQDSTHIENRLIEIMNEAVKGMNDTEGSERFYECNIEERIQEKVFKCTHCDYVTKHSGYIRVHIRKHTGEKRHACSVCGKLFGTSKDRNRHEVTHSKDKAFKCYMCEDKFAEKNSLVKHMRFHTGEDLFHCRICGKVFIKNWHLESHMQTHAEKPYRCSKCTKSFAKKDDCYKHEVTHEAKTLTCDICKRIFFNKNSFKRHVLGHERKVIPSCSTCGETFSSKSKLKSHLQVHKAEDSKKPENCNEYAVSCSMCEETFTENSEFRRHMRIHAVNKIENPFKCNICDKSFKLSTNLKRHMMNHENENPYTCPECPGKQFVSSRQLWRHKRGHNGKCHCCDLCGKKYSSSFSLKEHLKNHGDDPIQCPKCSYIFATKDALNKHMKRCKSVVRTYKYKCPLCFMAYAVKQSVIRHVRMNHAFEEEKDDVKASSSNTQKTFLCSYCEKCFSSERSLEWHKVCIHLLVTPMVPGEAVNATRRMWKLDDTMEKEGSSVIYVDVNNANEDAMNSMCLRTGEDESAEYDKKSPVTLIKREPSEDRLYSNNTLDGIIENVDKDVSSALNNSEDEDPFVQVENYNEDRVIPKEEKCLPYVFEGLDCE